MSVAVLEPVSQSKQLDQLMVASYWDKRRRDWRLLPATAHALRLAIEQRRATEVEPVSISNDQLRRELAPRHQQAGSFDDEAISHWAKWLEQRYLIGRHRPDQGSEYAWFNIFTADEVAPAVWPLFYSFASQLLGRGLSPVTIAIASRLAFASDEDGFIAGTRYQLARVADCDPKTVLKHLTILEADCLVEIEQKSGPPISALPMSWKLGFQEAKDGS